MLGVRPDQPPLGGQPRRLGRGLGRCRGLGGFRLGRGGQLPFPAGKQPLLLPIVQGVQHGVLVQGQLLGQGLRGEGFPAVAQHPQEHLQLLLPRQL